MPKIMPGRRSSALKVWRICKDISIDTVAGGTRPKRVLDSRRSELKRANKLTKTLGLRLCVKVPQQGSTITLRILSRARTQPKHRNGFATWSAGLRIRLRNKHGKRCSAQKR